jgi:hypothetical protein
MTQLATERISGMNDSTLDLDQNEQEIFTNDVSDEALEAVAQQTCATSGYWACPTID